MCGMSRATAALLAAMTLALLASVPSAASAATCGGDFNYDSEGYLWDFSSPNDYGMGTIEDGGGNVRSGGGDTYDEWGMLFVGDETLAAAYVPSGNDSCFNEDSGREQVFPTVSIGGLDVQRKVYVSATGLPGARILNIVHNPSDSPRTTSIQVGNLLGGRVGTVYGGSLGSDDDTRVRASSEDDGSITRADTWAVTSDHSDGDPSYTNDDFALAHVFDGSGGADTVDFATLQGGSRDQLGYGWRDVTIPAGGTVAYISYEVQQAVAGANGRAEDEAAKNAALAYAARPLPQIFAGMSDPEIAAVRNWPHPEPTASFAPLRRPTDRAQTVLSAADSTASSVPGSCAGITYAWDLGAGVPATGAQVVHRFPAGSNEVALTVTNSCGASATSRRTIDVADTTPPAARLRAPRSARLSRIAVRLRSSENGRAVLRLKVGRSTVASARLHLRAGRAKAVRLRTARPGRARLAVTVSDLAGNTVQVDRAITLHR